MSDKRADLRRTNREVQKQSKKYTLTNAEIDKIKKDAAEKAIDIAMTLMLGLPVMVLHDKYGFREVRLKRFIDQVHELYDSYEKGLLTLKDIHDTLLEDVGITISLHN